LTEDNINKFKEEEDNFNCFNSTEYVLIGTK